MKLKYFNIVWFRQHSDIQGVRGRTFFLCIVMYTYKHLRYKLYRNLVTCVCVLVYSCSFIGV